MNVLITHECSGTICREFRAIGHSAFSCDIVPRTDGNTRHHILGDAISAMRKGRPTDGAPWDLVITHHVCRYLANSGSLRLYLGGKRQNGMDLDRFSRMRDAAENFRSQFLVREYQGPLCAENPIMHKWAREIIDIEGIEDANFCKINKQTIQPYDFKEDASKATQLWLRGLPALKPTGYFPPRMVCKECGHVDAPTIPRVKECEICGSSDLLPRWSNQTDSGQNALGPSKERAAIRAVTYPGIAKAMAAQWSEYINPRSNQS